MLPSKKSKMGHACGENPHAYTNGSRSCGCLERRVHVSYLPTCCYLLVHTHTHTHTHTVFSFSTNQMTGAHAEVALANEPRFRSIRLFTASPTYDSKGPHADVTVMQPWSHANSTSVGGGLGPLNSTKPFSYFSAACWVQGRHLFDKLGGTVPLGLMTSAVGGTRIHCWSSKDALKKCPQYLPAGKLPTRVLSMGVHAALHHLLFPLLSYISSFFFLSLFFFSLLPFSFYFLLFLCTVQVKTPARQTPTFGTRCLHHWSPYALSSWCGFSQKATSVPRMTIAPRNAARCTTAVLSRRS